MRKVSAKKVLTAVEAIDSPEPRVLEPAEGQPHVAVATPRERLDLAVAKRARRQLGLVDAAVSRHAADGGVVAVAPLARRAEPELAVASRDEVRQLRWPAEPVRELLETKRAGLGRCLQETETETTDDERHENRAKHTNRP